MPAFRFSSIHPRDLDLLPASSLLSTTWIWRTSITERLDRSFESGAMPFAKQNHTSLPTSEPSPASSQPSQYLTSQSQHKKRNSLAQPPASLLPQPRSPSQLQQQQQQQQLGDIAKSDEPLASKPSKGDFCLVAEAAKRAQMQVLMRDMAEFAL